MEKIKLHNRYGDDVHLERIGGYKFRLGGDLGYSRFGYADKEMTKIDFIDPSGGPFMQIGAFRINYDGKELILSDIQENKLDEKKYEQIMIFKEYANKSKYQSNN